MSETLFQSHAYAQTTVAAWRDEYNRMRSHGALGGLTPVRGACSRATSTSRTTTTPASSHNWSRSAAHVSHARAE
ncbi:MAG: transposase [Methylobacterium sp.]|uniref:integrase core domain-containing protein n=1 Tax=Methylobacterium sp. TaxID=409 RepID=UPI003451B13B|nr:transposase [Methylobacterium sp.]